MSGFIDYSEDVQAIKGAILHSQYRAAAGTNAVQLGLYYGVGKYMAARVASGAWGDGSLRAVTVQLRRELLGLPQYGRTDFLHMDLLPTDALCLSIQSK